MKMTEIITRKEAFLKGLGKYFTGSPCRNGHVAERYTKSGTCQECISSSRAMIIIPKRGEIITPERQNSLEQYNEHQSILRRQRDRKLELEEKALELKTRELEMKMAIETERLSMTRENQARRNNRQQRTATVKGELVEVIICSDPLDYSANALMIWVFAAQRNPLLKPEDVAVSSMPDCRYKFKCFPEDKLEILRAAGALWDQRNAPVLTLDIERKRFAALAALDAEAEDNGQPEGDPR